MRVVLLAALGAALGACTNPELSAWKQRAAGITIVRDDWGIPHVYGKTDADVVFGVMYAQAEDDFNRIEANYLESMGRQAEADGEERIWRDLRTKLFIDPDTMRARFDASPPWLQALMGAWADGLNFYLATHPDVKPRVITRFEPWMALTFTEGSIGNDIGRVNLRGVERFYGGAGAAASVAVAEGLALPEPTGSNGIAIGAPMTANGKAMLLINPHTTFYFRAEAQMVSEEGLNAYGALTWGQFFIYQGFNATAGWMHTSSGADRVDEYLETIVRKPEGLFYKVGEEERPLVPRQVTVPFRTDTGMARREFTVYYTHRGPIVREMDGKWVSARLMQEPVKALMQSYSRTKARNLAEYRETMDLHTNSSNNTLFADAEGNFAYFHANFVPRRDPRFDWSRPVDGSDPATEWQGLHSVDGSPLVVNPPNGWVFNTNNWPYSAAGPNSPRQQDFPKYMDVNVENPRGLHAIRVLSNRTGFTLDSLLAAAFDSYMPTFEPLIPALISAYDRTPASNPLKDQVREQVELLRAWDYRWGVESVATSLAIYWAEDLFARVRADTVTALILETAQAAARAPAQQQLEALAAASAKLEADFGSWKTPWGNINRHQRFSANLDPRFHDDSASIPVAFTSANWGSLASFRTRRYPGGKRLYGYTGNSFVAAVEFGDSVRARAVMVGGQSGDPRSKHFNDQAERYATGNLRPVYFYRSQLDGHIERTYNPGK